MDARAGHGVCWEECPTRLPPLLRDGLLSGGIYGLVTLHAQWLADGRLSPHHARLSLVLGAVCFLVWAGGGWLVGRTLRYRLLRRGVEFRRLLTTVHIPVEDVLWVGPVPPPEEREVLFHRLRVGMAAVMEYVPWYASSPRGRWLLVYRGPYAAHAAVFHPSPHFVRLLRDVLVQAGRADALATPP